MSFIEDYYAAYREDERLLSRHGQVEYLTTMHYIEAFASKSCRILEIGAGTGRYSVTLAKMGYRVTAVELVKSNLDQLLQKLTPDLSLTAMQGNALDLSVLPSDSFDVTLLLGPMYHLYSREDQVTALKEALRVTRKGGKIMTAYCMNEPTVIQFVFQRAQLKSCLEKKVLTEDFKCISTPEDVFSMVRTEEIEEINRLAGAHRLKLIAADGATNYMRPLIDGMDDETFSYWMKYHFATCERGDLIGASNHVLDISEK